MYPFGHGLTYTSFHLALTDVTVTADTLHARAAVRNVGTRTGTSVVQLYVRDEEATVVRPVRQLVDFGRITLAAGVSEDVDFVVPLRRLAYTWPDGRRGLEAGQVTLLLGRSSADICDQRTVDVPQIVLA